MLVISNLYPPAQVGGYEVLCAEAVRCLAERHEITVLTSDHQGVPSEPGIVRELAYLPMGTRHTLRAPSATVHAARVTRRLVDEVRPELVFVWNGAAMPQAAIRIAEQSGASTRATASCAISPTRGPGSAASGAAACGRSTAIPLCGWRSTRACRRRSAG
jgi:hypothetical protein